MELRISYLIVLVVSYLFVIGNCQKYDVTNYGAVGNGVTDDSQAFLKAWQAVCGARGSTQTLVIPSGKTFLLQPLRFEGPCKSGSINVQVYGNLVAPKTAAAWQSCTNDCWISFYYVKGFVIDGTGKIDGQGSSWWNGQTSAYAKCSERPVALQFHGCDGLQVKGIHVTNSPRSHISISGSSGVFISNININSPATSPNTDGIDISASQHVKIYDSFIAAGDDCVAINTGSVDINITNVLCGPGHGISVGSLGEGGSHQTAEQIHVYNCTFSGTENGARIKTWPGGSGYAKQISFEKIILINAKNPIIIDQHYCIGNQKCTKKTTAVAVSDVTYSGFTGTSASLKAITFDCDSNIGCTGIVMDNVNIVSSNPKIQLDVVCNNAHGKATYTTPRVSCLSG